MEAETVPVQFDGSQYCGGGGGAPGTLTHVHCVRDREQGAGDLINERLNPHGVTQFLRSHSKIRVFQPFCYESYIMTSIKYFFFFQPKPLLGIQLILSSYFEE